MRQVGLYPVASYQEAEALARRFLGREDYKVTVMTQAANTVPLLGR